MFFDSDANAGTVKPMGVSPPEAAVYLLLIIPHLEDVVLSDNKESIALHWSKRPTKNDKKKAGDFIKVRLNVTELKMIHALLI